MESSSFDFYLQNSDFVWEPAGQNFFFLSKSAKLEKIFNSSKLPVSFLFFLINSQSLGSLFITSCLVFDMW